VVPRLSDPEADDRHLVGVRQTDALPASQAFAGV
jgi:hypothetical protein